ncbi:nucleotidyltransferase domain-containing protein [bacterium SCSIO 12643]|nr:nucleotidyltransferase domain-containing protein [bacterium SCSIO 12643]
MENQILKELKRVEEVNNVELLFAVESGSRAWGFESPDSDYDVRFVYRRGCEAYLSLWDSKDTIEFMTEDNLDGSGWDFKKATLLLSKSNASFLGWLFSPIVYIERGDVLRNMKKLAIENFNPVSGFYHYQSMNKGFYQGLKENDMDIKSFFYTARTALCANWILKFGSIPPVRFKELYALIDQESMQLFDTLMDKKATIKEKDKCEIDLRLVEVIHQIVTENNNLKDVVETRKANYKEFDRFFLNELL